MLIESNSLNKLHNNVINSVIVTNIKYIHYIRMCQDSQLREIISDTSTNLDEKGRILIREANRNGGKDNIAIVLVEPFADEVKAC